MLGSRIRLPHKPMERKPFLRRIQDGVEQSETNREIRSKPTTAGERSSSFSNEIDRLRIKMKELHQSINSLATNGSPFEETLGSTFRSGLATNQIVNQSLGVLKPQLKENNPFIQYSHNYKTKGQCGIEPHSIQFETSSLSKTLHIATTHINPMALKEASLTPGRNAHTQANRKREFSIAVGNDQASFNGLGSARASTKRNSSMSRVVDMTVSMPNIDQEKDIIKLKEDYKKLKSVYNHQVETNRRCKEDIANLQKELAKREEQLHHAYEDNNVYIQQNEKISGELKELMQACHELRQEVAKEVSNSQTLFKQTQPYRKRIAELELELQGIRNKTCLNCIDKSHRSDSIIDIAQPSSSSLLEIMDRVSESTLLHQRIAELDSVVVVLKEELSFYKDRLHKLEQDNSSLRNSRNISTSRCFRDVSQQQQQAIDDIILKHEQETRLLKQQIQVKTEQAYSLRGQLSTLQSKIKHLQNEIAIVNLKQAAEKKSMLNRMDMDRQNSQAEANSLRRSLTLAEEKNRILSSELVLKDKLITSRITPKKYSEKESTDRS